MQVYLPDELYDVVKTRRLPASELLQRAVKAELRRLDLLEAGDRYVAELVAQVGPVTVRWVTRAVTPLVGSALATRHETRGAR